MHKEKKALKEFETILKRYPDAQLTAGVNMWFGEYFYGKGRLQDAKKYFNSVISKYPDSSFVDSAYYWIAWTLYEEGDADKAISEFRKLYNKFPESEWSQEAMFRSGDILLEQGKQDEAIGEFTLVAEKYKNMPFARKANSKIGRIFADRKDFGGAINYFKKAQTVEDTDFNAQVQYDIAEAHELNGDIDEAVVEYLKVSYMYPRNAFWAARAELKCAAVLESLQRWDQAIKVYERLSKRDLKESKYAKERLDWLKLKE